MRSKGASSERDATSVTKNSECGEHIGIIAPFENASENNNVLHISKVNDETRNIIPDEVSDLSVLEARFDRKPHTHHNVREANSHTWGASFQVSPTEVTKVGSILLHLRKFGFKSSSRNAFCLYKLEPLTCSMYWRHSSINQIDKKTPKIGSVDFFQEATKTNRKITLENWLTQDEYRCNKTIFGPTDTTKIFKLKNWWLKTTLTITIHRLHLTKKPVDLFKSVTWCWKKGLALA